MSETLVEYEEYIEEEIKANQEDDNDVSKVVNNNADDFTKTEENVFEDSIDDDIFEEGTEDVKKVIR